MIETVEELIKVYYLDKEIEFPDQVYNAVAAKLYSYYLTIKQHINSINLTNIEIKEEVLRTFEKKRIEAAKQIENKVNEQPSNIQQPSDDNKPVNENKPVNNKPVAEVKKEPAIRNDNSRNEAPKINSNTKNELNEQLAHINIVQNAYVNGNKADEEDEDSNGCSAVNTININFGSNNYNQPAVNNPKKMIENKQPSNNITDKSQEEPDFSIHITPEEKVNLCMALIKLILMVAAVVGVVCLIYMA